MQTIITIVAFQDFSTNSIAYKKFTNIEKALAFYRKQLENPICRVISTRKVEVVGEAEGDYK